MLSAGTDIQKDAEGKAKQVQVVNLLVTPEQAETLSLASNQRSRFSSCCATRWTPRPIRCRVRPWPTYSPIPAPTKAGEQVTFAEARIRRHSPSK